MNKYPINVNRVNKEFTNGILKFYKWVGINLDFPRLVII